MTSSLSPHGPVVSSGFPGEIVGLRDRFLGPGEGKPGKNSLNGLVVASAGGRAGSFGFAVIRAFLLGRGTMELAPVETFEGFFTCLSQRCG